MLYGANQAYPSASNNLGWRVPLSIGLAAPTVSLVLQLFLLPESPSWLVVHSRKDDARKSIARLHPRLSEDELDEQVNLLIYTIEREKHIAIEVSSFLTLILTNRHMQTLAPERTIHFLGLFQGS